MSLWNQILKLFSSSRKSWRLCCPKCGATFEVGLNAFIVTDEDGCSLVESVVVIRERQRHPDRVGPSDKPLNDIQRKDAMRSMKSILLDIKAGNPRSWTHQGGCDAVNQYELNEIGDSY